MTIEEAKQRVHALKVAMGFGYSSVVMMADSGAARRQQERRLRIAKGIDLLSLPVRDIFRLTDFLVEHGFLREQDSEDRKAVSAATVQLLEEIVTRDWKTR
jgi:hypothetical protein